MTISGMIRRAGRPALSLASAFALMATAGLGGAAAAPKAAGPKTREAAARMQADSASALASQQKPVQLRYFGGPKSMMSAR
jgi:hypothetical protein